MQVMYFKSSLRYNKDKQQSDAYYRLVESYRNAAGRVCHRTILNIGFAAIPISYRKVVIFIITFINQFTTHSTFTFSSFKHLPFLLFVEEPLGIKTDWVVAKNRIYQRLLLMRFPR